MSEIEKIKRKFLSPEFTSGDLINSRIHVIVPVTKITGNRIDLEEKNVFGNRVNIFIYNAIEYLEKHKEFNRTKTITNHKSIKDGNTILEITYFLVLDIKRKSNFSLISFLKKDKYRPIEPNGDIFTLTYMEACDVNNLSVSEINNKANHGRYKKIENL